MSSLLAAEGEACDGLGFLGYPLHPAKQPEKLRSAHFPDIHAPALFLSGTRDALCELRLLRRELEHFAGPHRLQLVDEADHDFAVPKRTGLDREGVLDFLAEHIDAWERALPAPA